MEGSIVAPAVAHRKGLLSVDEGTGGFRRAFFAFAVIAASATAFFAPAKSYAGDLGGPGSNCCADLEEHIADLESTVARKGNRKISVTVYGTINEAIMGLDAGDGYHWTVGHNSDVDSFIGVRGEAVVAPHFKVGYVLEIGIGGGNLATNPLGSPFNTAISTGGANETYTQRSFGYVQSDQFGALSLGLNNQATKDIMQIDTANTTVAARVLSLRPIVGPQIGEALDIYEGGRASELRYDSPVWMGAQLSATWSNGGIAGLSTGDVWDVALRWAGEGNGFQVKAGVGYRKGIVIDSLGSIGSVSFLGIDPEVFSGSASVKHVATGLFLSGAYGHFDLGALGGGDTIESWELQGGIEQKWLTFGYTTVFGEYADSNDLDLKYWGGGVVQHFDAAALDLYGSVRRYEFDGEDATLLMAGTKIDF